MCSMGTPVTLRHARSCLIFGILGIAECLLREGPPAVRLVRLLARGLEDMAQAAMAKDHHALEEAAGDACDAMRGLIKD